MGGGKEFSTLNSAVLGSQLHTHHCQGRRSPRVPPQVRRQEVGDCKFSIPLPSHKLYLCLWESIVYNPL